MQEIDINIIKGCIAGDTRAEYALYTACFQTLMSVTYRYTRSEDDAADLVNKGFLKIITNLSKYDTAQPFNKWMVTVMINTIIDEFRSNKTYKTLMQHTDIYPVEPPSSMNVTDAEAKLNIQDIQRCINRLPDASKMVLNLYVFEGLSHKEIAKALTISEGTSKWHLSNARNLLKQIMKKAMTSIKVYAL
ncbi:MAG: RNA polymerase sigma factor [Bacteroidota bacterium]